MWSIVVYAIPFYLLSYSGQVLLKKGLNSIGGLSLDRLLADPLHVLVTSFLTGYIPAGLLLMAGGSLFYLFLLSMGDFSYVLPLLGALSFLALPAIGVFVLREPFDLWRLVGTVIITIGALIVARK